MAILDTDDQFQSEPRWPVMLVVVAIALFHFALPEDLTLGPSWILPALAIPLLIPAAITHRMALHNWNRRIGIALLTTLTVFVLYALIVLVTRLLVPTEPHLTAPAILKSASLLWVTNVLVFALWYWRLDAGGPHERELRQKHEEGAFLFPQMTLTEAQLATICAENWSPGFVDYLFLAFNTSTALSPADTSALSRWAKCLMMLQSTISLSIVVLLAARAVNILN